MSRRGAHRPRVLIIVENVALARDHRVRKQVRSLLDDGVEVSIICPRDPGNHQVAGLHVHEYRPAPEPASKWGFIVEYAWAWAMVAVLTAVVVVRRGVDVVQVCGAPDIWFPLARLLRLGGVRIVYDQRDPSPELFDAHFGSGPSRLRSMLVWLEAATYRAADHVIVVNGSLRELARMRGGVPDERITVVGNGPVLARVRPRAARPELKGGRPLLCTWHGLLGPQDGVDHALRAVAHLVHEHDRVDCSFAFIGDGEGRTSCERLAGELGIRLFVSFPGWMSEDDVFAHLATADVAIEPNLEPVVSPVKVMEDMAFGVPVVAFDLPETRALARSAAVYAPAGDDVALAHALLELLDDPARRARLGACGTRLVETSIAWDHQASAYLAVFHGLYKGEGGSDAPFANPWAKRSGRAHARRSGRRGRQRAAGGARSHPSA